MSTADDQHRNFVSSFGLERLGLIGLRAPALVSVLIAIATVLGLMGLTKLQVDDSLSELFRTNTDEFRRYEAIDRKFPSSEYDVLVVVEGHDLLQRKQLEAFAGLTTELQLVDGVSGLVSMLSARAKPDASGYAPPLVPDELPEDGTAYDAMIASLKSNDIVPEEIDRLKEISELREKLKTCSEEERPPVAKLLRDRELALAMILERNKRK